MGRPKRTALGGWVYHVLNRANARMPIFTKDQDFIAFETVLTEAVASTGTRLLSYSLMRGDSQSFPVRDDNHFLTTCRSVERNALLAKLAKRAEDGRWSSRYLWHSGTAAEKEEADQFAVRVIGELAVAAQALEISVLQPKG